MSNGISEFTKNFVDKVNGIGLATFYPAKSYSIKRREINKMYSSLADLRKAETDLFRQLMLIPLLDPKKLDLTQLHGFLKANINSLVSSTLGTHFRKLVCLYDFLKYKHSLSNTAV